MNNNTLGQIFSQSFFSNQNMFKDIMINCSGMILYPNTFIVITKFDFSVFPRWMVFAMPSFAVMMIDVAKWLSFNSALLRICPCGNTSFLTTSTLTKSFHRFHAILLF